MAAREEMLNVPRPSPPVPQVSSTLRSLANGFFFRRSTVANPARVSGVMSFGVREASTPAICASVSCPSVSSSMNASASARLIAFFCCSPARTAESGNGSRR